MNQLLYLTVSYVLTISYALFLSIVNFYSKEKVKSKTVAKEKQFPTSISEADMYTARVTKDSTNIMYGKA